MSSIPVKCPKRFLDSHAPKHGAIMSSEDHSTKFTDGAEVLIIAENILDLLALDLDIRFVERRDAKQTHVDRLTVSTAVGCRTSRIIYEVVAESYLLSCGLSILIPRGGEKDSGH